MFHNRLLHLLAIMIVTLVAYANTFSVPFVFDDKGIQIVENPLVTEPGSFPVSAFIKNNRPVAVLSFALNYAVHGLSVWGYHLVNLLIHMGNGLLLYALVLLSFRTPFMVDSGLRKWERWIALFGALLFVSHPLQTQAVTYIVQRMASMATLFYLLCLVSYIQARLAERPKVRYAAYALSVISAVLAMKTKEIAFTLPVMVALYEAMFFRGKWPKRLLFLVPLMLTMLIIPVSMVGIDKPLGDVIGDVSHATRVDSYLERSEYLATQGRVIMTYLRLLILPYNQSIDYDYPVHRSFRDSAVLGSFGVLALLVCLGIYLLMRSRKGEPGLRLVAYGIFWFFITLSVESSVIPIIDVIFEHRMYLPMIGVVLVLSPSLCMGIEMLSRRKPQAIRAGAALLAMVIVILTSTTFIRNMVWGDELTLWTDAMNKNPGNMRAHFNVASAYMDKGFADKAIVEYKNSLRRVWPNYHYSHNNLGNIYRSQGMLTEAIQHYRAALAIMPDFPEALNNLANAYAMAGNMDDAITHYHKAISLDPDYAPAHSNLGNVYAKKGMFDEAIKEYKRALQLNPGYEDARYNLSVVRRMRNKK